MVRNTPGFIHLQPAWKLIACTLLLAGIALSPSRAHAAATYTFNVLSTADVHDLTPGDGICDTPPASAAHGACTLRGAVDEASHVPAGSYVNIGLHKAQYKVPLGTLTLTNSIITIVGLGQANTIIGDSANPITGSIFDNETNSIIKALTITGGHATNGGGVYDGGALVLQDVRVYKNLAQYGGGVYKDYRPSSTHYIDPLSVVNGALDSNEATHAGGGLYIASVSSGPNGQVKLQGVNVVNNLADVAGGGVYTDDNLSVYGGVFQNNTAGKGAAVTGQNGGAIFATKDASAHILGGNFLWNHAGDSGGGFYNEHLPTGTPLRDSLTNSIFMHNTAVIDGGAIYIDRESSLTGLTVKWNTAGDSTHQGIGGGAYVDYPSQVYNSTFDHNTAAGPAANPGQGGGVYSNDNNDFSRDHFTNNLAYDGAGLYENFDNVPIRSSTFTGNHATHDGGGLYELGSGPNAYIVLSASTITGNRADHDGGGIWSNPNAVYLVDGSTVTGNSAGNMCNDIFPCA